MTELIYYKDQYKKEIEAKVVEVQGNRLLLDKTIFIPQTNNEPGDFGKINNLKIAGSKKEGKDVWHIFPKPVPFREGEIVRLELDWNTRIMPMRLHSALHLLASVFEKDFRKRAVAGAIKGKTAYLVFKEEIPEEIANKGLEQANKEIEKEIEIKSCWDEKREGFRWVQIGDYTPIPCGGLHVKNTKEIAAIIFAGNLSDCGKQKIIISVKASSKNSLRSG